MTDPRVDAPKKRMATAMSERSLERHSDPTLHERAERWEQRLAIPVLVAALVSVPAIFLMTTTDGVPEAVGRALNWASMTVLLGESLVLVLLSQDIVNWVRAHRWELLLAAATVPAVVFAVGPVQILRVVLAAGTLRVLRVRRILRAGRVLMRNLQLGARRRKVVLAAVVVLAGTFLGVVLANPNSKTRRFFTWLADQMGIFPTILVGLMVAGALYVTFRWLTVTKLDTLLHPGRRRQSKGGLSARGPRADR